MWSEVYRFLETLVSTQSDTFSKREVVLETNLFVEGNHSTFFPIVLLLRPESIIFNFILNFCYHSSVNFSIFSKLYFQTRTCMAFDYLWETDLFSIQKELFFFGICCSAICYSLFESIPLPKRRDPQNVSNTSKCITKARIKFEYNDDLNDFSVSSFCISLSQMKWCAKNWCL